MTCRRRLPLPLLGAVLAGLAGCSGPDPAVSSVVLPAPRAAASGAAGPATAPRGAPAAIPAAPGQRFAAPAPGQAVRDGAALAAACRQEADRIVLYRDRGQIMREDERDARVGTDSSIFARRTETDRLGRQFERDRIAEDCVQQNTRSAPQQTPPPR